MRNTKRSRREVVSRSLDLFCDADDEQYSDSEDTDDFVDSDGDSILHTAIILTNSDIVYLFLSIIQNNSILLMTNNLRQTVLHLAVLVGDPELCRQLMVAGADVEARDRNGNTALHLACMNGYVEVTKALLTPVTFSETKLLSYSAPYQKIPQNLELRNYEGLTCFLIAVVHRCVGVIRVLLYNDVNINIRFLKDGKTCLHYLVEQQDVELLRFLLRRRDVDLGIKTYAGYTPLDIAYLRDYYDIEYILLLHKGRRNKTKSNQAVVVDSDLEFSESDNRDNSDSSNDSENYNSDDCNSQSGNDSSPQNKILTWM